MSNDIREVKMMLEALLRSDGLVAWVGGYVYGRTSQDDPFIILYPAADYLKEKVCRVYPHQFKRLPDFIPTGDVPADTENNPSKGTAQRAGIYHECRPFKIVMHLGKESPMGREKRFAGVLYIPPQRQAPEPAPAPAPAANGHGPDEEADVTDWDRQVARSMKVLVTPEKVARARTAICGPWDETQGGRYLIALYKYESILLEQVDNGETKRNAHEPALTAAKRAFAEAVPEE
ncbi:MAG: hypothetical protein ACOC9Z_08300 [Chloroflexota bacterium]